MNILSLARALVLYVLISPYLFASIGHITAFSGEVFVQRGAKSQKATPNFQLEEKDTVRSSAGAVAQLVFKDKTVITVGSNTTFKIEEYLFGEKDVKVRFGVGEGTFKSVTGKIAKIAPEKFKIETRTATIGIRGTVLIGYVDKQGVLTVACTKGAISVTPNTQVSPPVVVNQGQFTKADEKGVDAPKTFNQQELRNLEKDLATDKKAQSGQGSQQSENTFAGVDADTVEKTPKTTQTDSAASNIQNFINSTTESEKQADIVTNFSEPVATAYANKDISFLSSLIKDGSIHAKQAETALIYLAYGASASDMGFLGEIKLVPLASVRNAVDDKISASNIGAATYTILPASDASLSNNALKVTYGGVTKYFKYIDNVNSYGTDETFGSIGELVVKLNAFTGGDVNFYLDNTTNKISYGFVNGTQNSLMLSSANPSIGFLGFSNTPLSKTADTITTMHRSAMTTLSDGRVFAYGGFDGSNHLPISQIYNPTTGTWSAATNTNVPTLGEGVGIVALDNGGAMLAGGWSSAINYDTWFWNDSTGWTQGANSMLNTGDFNPGSPTYVDVANQVFAKAGGKVYSISKNSYVQYYDPGDGAWHWFDQQTNTPAFSGHSGTALSGSYADKILVFGGSSSATYMFDPSVGNVAGAWSQKADMLAASSFGSSVLLADGSVLAIGGAGLNAIQAYNPLTDTWSYKTPLPFSFVFGSAATINNGTSVLLAGGQQDGIYSQNSYIYAPSLESTKYAASMVYSRVGFVMTKLQDGSAFAVGGFNYDPINYDVPNPEKYNPNTKQWTLLNPSGSFTPRMGLAAATLSGGNVLVAGGNDGWGSVFGNVDLYDVGSNAWIAKAALPTTRWGFGLAALANNRAIAIGGRDTDNGIDLKDTLIFDLTTNTWTAAAPMDSVRVGLAAVTMQNGKVLAMGGGDSGGSSYLSSVEMYDPGTNSWSYKASMLSPRSSLSSVVLADGSVLAIGGSTTSGIALGSVEQYNVSTDTWQYKVPLPFTFTGGAAVSLNDGSVLVASGIQNGNITSTASWLYNPNFTIASPSAILAADYNAGLNNGYFIGVDGDGSKVVGNIDSMLFNANLSSVSTVFGELNGANAATVWSGYEPANTISFSQYSALPSGMTTTVNYAGEDNKIIWGVASIGNKAGVIGFASLPDKVSGGNSFSNVNDFSSWGYWEASSNDGTEYFSGYWVSGQPTDVSYIQQMINQHQVVNYNGHVLGDTFNGAIKDAIVLDGNNKLSMSIDFGSASPVKVNSLSFNTSKRWSYSNNSGFSGASSITVSDSSYAASLANGGQTLNMQGKFYGPQVNSTGGVFSGSLAGTDGIQRNVQGAFKASK